MNFKNKVAIVTGASSGVGYAIADTLASKGCNVVLAARRFEVLEGYAKRFVDEYKIRAVSIKTDLTNKQDIENLIDRTNKEFGRLDALVNVAGDFPEISFVESDPADFFSVYDRSRRLMLDAVIHASKLGLGLLIPSGGVIVNISSDAGLERKVYSKQLPYMLSKAAVNHATRGMDLELRDKGSRAFAIAPGNIDTPLLRSAIEGNQELIKLVEERVGSLKEFYRRILKPEDIARKVLEILQEPEKFKRVVIEMPSFEF